MAANIYNKQSGFNIDSLNVIDCIIKYNTVDYIEMEIIFNCDIEQIINKYSVNFSLVNPNNTSTVYAQFTPSGTNFGIVKNTIPVNGGLNTYTQQLSYFTFRYTNNNHFKNGNGYMITNSPTENSQFQLQITINGISKLYNTKRFNTYNNTPMLFIPTTVNYLQNYDMFIRNYYFENSDIVKIKINNQTSVSMSVNNIDNYYTAVYTPTRTNTVLDFERVQKARASFSGTNSYALVKTYNILSALTQTTLCISKNGFDDRKLNPPTQPNSYATALQVGCNKLFDTTLKNASGVSDTIYLEFPLFMGLSSSGLAITNIVITSTPNKVNFASAPIITALGLGKFRIDLSYSPTGEPAATTATYAASVAINFTHPTVGIITLSASGFTYTNSTG
ncbi:MAG: hypothetical protein RLZZ546_594 [Bacteroidota bacterium]|jgi:hypothetical protein